MTLLLANRRYAVMAALVAMIGLQTARLRGSQSDARALTAEVAQFRAAYDALAASAQRQNAAVNDWQAKAERAAQAGRRARADAAVVVGQHRARADALAAAVAAPAAGLTCGDAVQIVRSDLFQ